MKRHGSSARRTDRRSIQRGEIIVMLHDKLFDIDDVLQVASTARVEHFVG